LRPLGDQDPRNASRPRPKQRRISGAWFGGGGEQRSDFSQRDKKRQRRLESD
jgi:hypothetical protein